MILTYLSAGSSLARMARKLRVEYPGAVYHVMNRGDRREPIFRDDEDRQQFISTLGQTCGKTGWAVQALCLMPNSFSSGGKVTMAVRLRAETAVTVKWIAHRLQMGAPGYVNHLLYRRRKAKGE